MSQNTTATGSGTSAERASEKRKIASLLKIAEQCSALSCELEDFTRYYGEGFSILDNAHELECVAWQKYHKKNEQFHA
jgi:N6-adenosine-specific RNA methylase IME4